MSIGGIDFSLMGGKMGRKNLCFRGFFDGAFGRRQQLAIGGVFFGVFEGGRRAFLGRRVAELEVRVLKHIEVGVAKR